MEELNRLIHPAQGDPELCELLGIAHVRRAELCEEAGWASSAELGIPWGPPADEPPRPSKAPRLRPSGAQKLIRAAGLAGVDGAEELAARAEAFSRVTTNRYKGSTRWALRRAAAEMWPANDDRRKRLEAAVPPPAIATTRKHNRRYATALAQACSDRSD